MINVIKYYSPLPLTLPTASVLMHLAAKGHDPNIKSKSSKMDLDSRVLQRALLQAAAMQINVMRQSPCSSKGGKKKKDYKQ